MSDFVPKFRKIRREMTVNDKTKTQLLKNNILIIQSQTMPIEMKGASKVQHSHILKEHGKKMKDQNPKMRGSR